MYWEANSRKVYRVLTHKDIKNTLKDTDVYILWPDDGIWYMAEVEQVGHTSSSRCLLILMPLH
jgi:hypothetical protein